ncbi:MAG: hypothetical protein ACXVEF_36905 [Polyangiales bacterium]
MRVVRWASALLLTAGCMIGSGACKSGGVAISVDLRTDYVPGREFASVITEVVPDGSGPVSAEHPIAEGEGGFVTGTRVADFGDIPAGGLDVRVKVIGKEGNPLVERLARLTVSGDYALTVVVTRNCEGVVCPEIGGDPNKSTCDRGKCVSPGCLPGVPALCSDPECSSDVDCHTDAACVTAHCQEGTCLFVPDDAKCKPGQSCDVTKGCFPPDVETCKATGPTETICNDGVDDDCDGKIDCLDPDCDTKSCEDGDRCTGGETCQKSACSGGAPSSCDDGNACTDDSCDTAAGCMHTNKTSGSCEDGDACTDGDHCVDGKCTAGGPTSCDDMNPCTDDSCDMSGGCVHTPNTATCSDGNACTDGDVCADGACKPGTAKKCDDGNPCTDDSCDPASGCKKTNNTLACDDGLFCNGTDTCSGGSCSAHAGTTCAKACSEVLKACTSCVSVADCGAVVYDPWSACGGFASTCSTTGTQTRNVHTPTSCSGGVCGFTVTVESQACTRPTDGSSCGTVTYGAWSACAGFSSTCDTAGTRTRSVLTPTCAGGTCTTVTTTETGTCTRTTDGTSCQTTAYGSWSTCGGFATACDSTGSQSRSKTTYACASGACKGTAGSESRSCTRSVANGTGCGTGKYCCSGGCYAKNDKNHCSSCGIVCNSGSCVGIGSGHYSCTCTSNSQCQGDGFGSGATCWAPSGQTYCNCQCTTANCCAGGADCYKPSGLNYCSY